MSRCKSFAVEPEINVIVFLVMKNLSVGGAYCGIDGSANNESFSKEGELSVGCDRIEVVQAG